MAARETEIPEQSVGTKFFGATASRRTMLTAAAWSTPVLAIATATPAFAASGGVDLAYFGTAGEVPQAVSEDGFKVVAQSIPHGFLLGNLGSTDIPAGTTLQVLADARWFSNLSLEVNGTATDGGAGTTSGNIRTWNFVISTPIPVSVLGGSGLPTNGVDVRFLDTLVEPLPFVEDLEPLQLLFTPAGGGDVDPTNNTVRSEAQYSDTFDMDVASVDWKDHVFYNAEGSAALARLADSAVLRANDPGDVPEGTLLLYGVPSSEVEVAVSASIDGVSAPGFITLSGNQNWEYFRAFDIVQELPAGKSAVLTFTPAVSDGLDATLQNLGEISISGVAAGDRDPENNQVAAPGMYDSDADVMLGTDFTDPEVQVVRLNSGQQFEAHLERHVYLRNNAQTQFSGMVTAGFAYDARILTHTLPAGATLLREDRVGNLTRVVFAVSADVPAGVLVGDTIEAGLQDLGSVFDWNPAMGSPAAITGEDPIGSTYSVLAPTMVTVGEDHGEVVPIP